jgi:hypothetical protein
MRDFTLHSDNAFSRLARKMNLQSWHDLITHVCKLPYGRNSDRADFSLVLTEEKGSCSSKHALLKSIADENEQPDIQLILGIYKMNNANTPGIGSVLSDQGLTYIPEAHCYLKQDGKYYDFTSSAAKIERLMPDLLLEESIEPEQVIRYKVNRHKHYLNQWIKSQRLAFNFDEVWTIREACIHALENKPVER